MPASTIALEVVSSPEVFRDLRGGWNALLEASPKKSFFLSWEWQYSWWEFYHREESPRELNIVLAKDEGGAPCAILPLYRQRVSATPFGRLDLLRPLGFPYESSEYLDLISAEGMESSEVERFYDSLLDSGADGLVLTDVLPDSLLLCSVSLWARKRGLLLVRRARNVCPYVPLEGNFEGYLKTRSKSMRYTLRRRTRSLEKLGKVVARRVQEEGEAREAVRTLFNLHRKRWLERGRSGFDREKRRKFHETLAARALEAGLLRLYFLEVDGRPGAAAYCFRYGDTVYYYQAGMDPAFNRQSAGMVLLGKAIEASIEEGVTEFDLLRGPEDYKFHWTDRTRETWELRVAFSQKAKLCFAAGAHLDRAKGKIKGSLRQLLHLSSSSRRVNKQMA